MSKLLAPVVVLALVVIGCGSGYSEPAAIDRCEIEAANNGSCFNAAANESCIACFEECGDSCRPGKTCPVTYDCQ